jgi:hypothetical protein
MSSRFAAKGSPVKIATNASTRQLSPEVDVDDLDFRARARRPLRGR